MARARSGSARSSAPSSGAPNKPGRGAGGGSRAAAAGAKSAKTAKSALSGATPTKPADDLDNHEAVDIAKPQPVARAADSAEAPELLAATPSGAEGPIVTADVEPEPYPMTAEISVVDASTLLDDLAAPPTAPAVAVRPQSPPSFANGPSRPVPTLGRPDIHADGPAVRVPSPKARRAAKRLVARKVGRIVRHVDPWSVLKVALLFNLFGFLISLVCAVLLWQLVSSFGVISDIEGFITEAFALESFAFNGRQIFRIVATGGMILAVAATAGAVLLAVVFNLVSDLTGGIRVSVVEEETARPDARRA